MGTLKPETSDMDAPKGIHTGESDTNGGISTSESGISPRYMSVVLTHPMLDSVYSELTRPNL